MNGIFLLKDRIEKDFIVKSAKLVVGDKEEVHTIKIPKKFKGHLSKLADPWVILSLHKFLRIGGDINIHGPVSKSLLDNCYEYCKIWNYLIPDYKMINFVPEKEINDYNLVRFCSKRKLNDAIVSFSGGLDACFTLYRHRNNLAGRNNKNIKQAVLVYGAGDTPLEKDKDFILHKANTSELCQDMGVPLDVVETNFLKFPNDWEREHFNVIACVLNFFKDYRYKLIASSLTPWIESYKRMPWSSNPVTDHLLSSNNAIIITDDMSFNRTDKARIVKNWSLAKQKMRVCWENEDKAKNCGCCEKCIRTMLNFIFAGEK